jgi:hypothetical protein
LIDPELWDRVQAFSHKNYKPRRRKDGETNLFTGLLYCADCGFKLRGQVERSIRKDGSEHKYVSYMCGTYAHSGKDACTIHSVNEKTLCSLVVDHIRTHALLIKYDEERILAAVTAAQAGDTMSYRAAYQNELEIHRKQLAKLDLLIESLCEDRASGLVPGSMFRRQIQKYEQDRAERLQAADTLEHRIKGLGHNTDNASAWIKLMKQYTGIATLDQETLLLLIDKIIVSEAKIVNGLRICDVKIIYNYVGDVDRLKLDAEGVTVYDREAV